MTFFCVQFWFCWIAVLPELDYIENGQNVIKSASSAEYASNVQMVTLQSSSKNWPSTALQKDIKS